MGGQQLGTILVPYSIYRNHSESEVKKLLLELKKRYCIINFQEDDYNLNMIFHFNASNEKYKFVKVLSLKETYYSKGEIKCKKRS